jgi:hypothetical protein
MHGHGGIKRMLTAKEDPAHGSDLILLLHEMLSFLRKEILNHEVDESSVDQKTGRAMSSQ